MTTTARLDGKRDARFMGLTPVKSHIPRPGRRLRRKRLRFSFFRNARWVRFSVSRVAVARRCTGLHGVAPGCMALHQGGDAAMTRRSRWLRSERRAQWHIRGTFGNIRAHSGRFGNIAAHLWRGTDARMARSATAGWSSSWRTSSHGRGSRAPIFSRALRICRDECAARGGRTCMPTQDRQKNCSDVGFLPAGALRIRHDKCAARDLRPAPAPPAAPGRADRHPGGVFFARC
jgi:hypothetical protein